MAGKYSIETTFRLIDEITKPLEKIGDAGGAFGDIFKSDMVSAENRVNDFIKTIGGIAIVGAITAGLGIAVDQFIEFDDSLHKAGALFSDLDPQAGDFTERLRGLGQAARDVAAITEFNAQQTAEALATMAMAGMKTDQALALLPRTANLATAAGLDLSTAVGMAADTLGVFNLMSEDSDILEANFKRVSDIMVRTASLANQDISQVSAAMSGGGAFFNKGNQGIEDIGAMIDALASRNLKGAEAGTAIRNVMLRLSAPGSDPAKDAMGALGLMRWEGTGKFVEKGKNKGQEIGEWVSDILDNEGNLINIIDIIDKLNAGVQGMGGAEVDANLKTLFGEGSIIAIKNLMDVGGDKLRAYSVELQHASDGMGATAKAAEAMRSSIHNIIEVLKSGLTELGFKFVEAFQDKGVYILKKITQAIEEFNPAPLIDFAVFVADRMTFLIDVLWNLRNVILFVVGAIVVYNAVTNAVRIAQMLATAASYAYNIVILKNTHALGFLKAETLAVRRATAAFSIAMKVGQAIMAAWNFTKYIAGLGAAKAAMVASKIALLAMTVAQKVAAVATGALSIATGVLNALFVASPIGWIILAIGALITIIILCVKNWDKISIVLAIAWDWIKKVASIIWDILITAFKVAVEWIKNITTTILNTLVVAFTTVIEWITTIAAVVWETLIMAFTAVVDWITRIATAIWDTLVLAFTTVVEWITTIAAVVWETLIMAFTAVVDWITRITTAIWEGLIGAFQNAIMWITGFISTIWDGLINAFTAVQIWIFSIVDSFKVFGGTILSAVLVPIQGILEVLAKIPGVGNLLEPAIAKLDEFRGGLIGIPPNIDVNQNISDPAGINRIVPDGITKTTTAVSPNTAVQTDQAIVAATVPPTPPVTRSEQMIYSQSENRENIDIGINTMPGTQAQVAKQPKSPNINLVVSGSNR